MEIRVVKNKPSECSNITEVREEIDNIDRAIIGLLSQRFEYVKEVVKYKSNDHQSIVAVDRRKNVLECRRKWAVENGLHPDVIEDVYIKLIDYFISEEIKIKNL